MGQQDPAGEFRCPVSSVHASKDSQGIAFWQASYFNEGPLNSSPALQTVSPSPTLHLGHIGPLPPIAPLLLCLYATGVSYSPWLRHGTAPCVGLYFGLLSEA